MVRARNAWQPQHSAGRRAVALLRGLGALVLLLLLLVGIPIGLWIVGQGWLPSSFPSLSTVWESVTSKDSGALFLGAAVVVGFGAWAIFAVSMMLELAARIRRRPMPRLRGFGWAQSISGFLLTAIITGLFATTATAATAPAAPPPAMSVVSATAAPGQAVTSARTEAVEATPMAGTSPEAGQHRIYPVEHHDTLWALAERWYDGDGMQYKKILQLNMGVLQQDGRSMGSDGQIRAGWRLLVPDDAKLPEQHIQANSAAAGALTGPVEVKPGETLSEIAEERLGVAARYMEIFEGNKGRQQPDGRSLTDPDQIHPGWKLEMPPAASGAPVAGHTQAPQPPVEQPVPAPSSTIPAPAPSSTAFAAPQPATSTVPSGQAAPVNQAPTAAEPDDGELSTIATPLTVSAVLAGVLITGLLVARRRQSRRRGTGRQVAVPSPPAVRIERAMRTAEARADITFLDLGLRSLSAVLATDGDQVADDLPEVVSAWLDPEGLRLLLAVPRPDAPEPFEATDDGAQWFLPATADLPVTTETAANYLAPLPTLVSVGRTEDSQLLLDLEGLGAVRIVGDQTKAIDLLRHLAAELSHNIWADGLDVLLVGFGEILSSLNPDRIRYVPTLEEALEGLQGRLDDVRAALETSDATSVLDGRVNDLTGDAWMPEVLLVACPTTGDTQEERPTEGDLNRVLGELATAGRSVVSVVATGMSGPTSANGAVLEVNVEGDLRIPEIFDGQLRSEGIPEDLAPFVVELFTAAQADDQAIPHAGEDEPWAEDMDASGRLVTASTASQTTADESIDNAESDDVDFEVGDSADEEPKDSEIAEQVSETDAEAEHEHVEATATGDDPVPQQDVDEEPETVGTGTAAGGRLVEFAPRGDSEAERQLARVEEQDPALDAELVEWEAKAEDCVRPRIGILGDPLVTAPGFAPTQRVAWYTEVLVYLALHPRGALPTKLVDDLWGGQEVKRVTYRQVMSTARKWAGTDSEGQFFLGHVHGRKEEEPYRIRDYLLDWTLFRRLRKRAQARAAAGRAKAAIEDYRSALKLVRGAALNNLRPGGYSWLANPDQCHDRHLPGFIAETAHELVMLALEARELELGEWAANTALTADPYRTDDRPLLDLMRLAHARGDEAALQSYAHRLIEDADAELPEDLSPSTFEVFNQLLPQGVRRLRQGA